MKRYVTSLFPSAMWFTIALYTILRWFRFRDNPRPTSPSDLGHSSPFPHVVTSAECVQQKTATASGSEVTAVSSIVLCLLWYSRVFTFYKLFIPWYTSPYIRMPECGISCNPIFYNITLKELKLQNYLACVDTRFPHLSHSALQLEPLHWFPIRNCILFKM